MKCFQVKMKEEYISREKRKFKYVICSLVDVTLINDELFIKEKKYLQSILYDDALRFLKTNSIKYPFLPNKNNFYNIDKNNQWYLISIFNKDEKDNVIYFYDENKKEFPCFGIGNYENDFKILKAVLNKTLDPKKL